MTYYPGMEFELPDVNSDRGKFDLRYGRSPITQIIHTLIRIIAIEKAYKAGSGDANNED